MRSPLLLVNGDKVITQDNIRIDPTSISTGSLSFTAPLTLSREQLENRRSPVSGMVCDKALPVAQRRWGGRQLHARRHQRMMSSCAAVTDMLDSGGSSINVETYKFQNRMSSTFSEATSSGYWSSRTSTARMSQLSMSDNATDTEQEAVSSQSTYEIDRLPYDDNYWTPDSVKSSMSNEPEERDSLSTLPMLTSHSRVECNVRTVNEAVSKSSELSSHPFPYHLSTTPTHGKIFIAGETKIRPGHKNICRRSHSLPSSSFCEPNSSELESTTSFLSSNSSSVSLDSDTTVGSPCELRGSLGE